MKTVWIVLCSFLLSFSSVKATHIIGGEMFYDCLGNGSYRITLKVYRDCFLGQAPFDAPANISVWSSAGTFVTNLSVAFPGSSPVPFIGGACFQAPPNVCVEEAIYQTIVPLNVANGLILAYQRCCRNNTIVNLVSPQSTGATYSTTIPPTSLVSCNSSPRFDNFPPIALCIGDTLRFDHAATDPDGDSLVYELCSTFAGGTTSDPMPIPTSAPPFDPIIFAAPYNAGYPIATSPPITLNPQTGLLVVTPNQLGQYVVGVCVKEYRNGVLLGTHSRDFQFNVTNCQTNVQANFTLPPDFIPDQDSVLTRCGGFDINFINQSVNASYYFWDFGVLPITTDTSSNTNPAYTYATPGDYEIVLIANPGYFCADTAKWKIRVKPLVNIDFAQPPSVCIDNNSYAFIPTGSYPPNSNIFWEFTPTANPPNSTLENPTNVQFPAPGYYQVKLRVEAEGCVDSSAKSLLIYGHPTVDFSTPNIGCDPYFVPVTLTVDSAFNNLSYFWLASNGATSTNPFPNFTFSPPGFYGIQLTAISTTGCLDTIVINRPNSIEVLQSPQAGFIAAPQEQSVFTPTFLFFDQSTGGDSCQLFFGDGNSSFACTTQHTYTDTGTYAVMQVVINELGCPDTAIQFIRVRPEFTFFIPNTFTIDGNEINETFNGKGIGIIEFQMRIYDRWGQVIYYTPDQNMDWDGRHYKSGEAVPPGIYVYLFDIVDVFGERHRYRGKVLLKRRYEAP